MKPPPLKGKAPVKSAKSGAAKANSGRRKSDSSHEAIDRVVTREQIELFCKIVRQELPKKIAEIDQLRRKEFNYERMKHKCLVAELELKRHFVELNSRAEVDAYMEMYTLADFSTNSFLFPNGLVPANRAIDELVKGLMEQLESLYSLTFECVFALELAVPAYDKRDSNEYSLLQEINDEFKQIMYWSQKQHSEIASQVLDFHAKEMVAIACYPQYEDRRKAYIRSEKRQLKELITIINYLFFVCMSLLDTVCKNGDKLGQILLKAHTGTH